MIFILEESSKLYSRFCFATKIKFSRTFSETFTRKKILFHSYIIFVSYFYSNFTFFSSVHFATFICSHFFTRPRFTYSPFCKWFAWKACWNIACCMMALEFSFVSFEILSCFQWKRGKFIDIHEKIPRHMHWKRLGVGAAQKLEKQSTVSENRETRSERRDEKNLNSWRHSIHKLFFIFLNKKTVVGMMGKKFNDKTTCW